MPRAFFSLHRLLSLPFPSRLFLLAFLCCLAAARPASAQMTLLVPSQPGIEAPAKAKEEQKKNTAEQNAVQAPAKAAPEAVQPPKPQDGAGKAKQQADGQIPATPDAAKALRPAKHIFSHIEWQMQGYLFAADTQPAPAGCVWASREALQAEYTLPGAFKSYKKLMV